MPSISTAGRSGTYGSIGCGFNTTNPPPAPSAGIPFWGTPGSIDNYKKPDYSQRLPASYSYAGDPTPTLTLSARLKTDVTMPAPDNGLFGTGAGANSQWLVTQSNYVTIPNGTTFPSLTNIWPVVSAEAEGTIILPAGRMKDQFLCQNLVSSIPFKHIIFRGQVDSNGFPATQLCPINSLAQIFSFGNVANVSINVGWHCDIRNIKFAPSFLDYQTFVSPIVTATGSGYTYTQNNGKVQVYTNVTSTYVSGSGLGAGMTYSLGVNPNGTCAGFIGANTVVQGNGLYQQGDVLTCNIPGGSGFRFYCGVGEGSLYASGGGGDGGHGFIFNVNPFMTFSVRNCWLHRALDNGMADGNQSGGFEMTSRQYYQVFFYDSQLSANNGAAICHNIYLHSVFCMFIRCFSHSSIVHCYKTEAERAIMLNNIGSNEVLYGDTHVYGQNRIWNAEGLLEVYAFQNVWRPAYLSALANHWAHEFAPRDSNVSCLSARRQNLCWYAINTGAGQAHLLKWVQGQPDVGTGINDPFFGSNYFGGFATGTINGGLTTISFHDVGTVLPGGLAVGALASQLPVGSNWNVQIILNDLSVFTTTGLITAGSNNTVTFSLATAIPAGNTVPSNNFAIFKLTSVATWDLPILNQACHDPTHPQWPWTSLNDGAASPRANLNSPYMVAQIIDSCMYYPISSDGSTNTSLLAVYFDHNYMTRNVVLSGVVNPPFPPIAPTQGEWTAPPGAGQMTQGLRAGTWSKFATSATGYNGWNGSALVMPNVTTLCDLMEYDQNVAPNTIGAQLKSFNGVSDGSNDELAGLTPDVRWLDSTGQVNKVNFTAPPSGGETLNFMPGPGPGGFKSGQTTLAANVAAGAMSITVASATGMVNGQRICFAMSGAPWSQYRALYATASSPAAIANPVMMAPQQTPPNSVEWFFTTIAPTYVAGSTTVPITQAVPFSCTAGDPVSFNTAAGPKPSWWPSITQWAMNTFP